MYIGHTYVHPSNQFPLGILNLPSTLSLLMQEYSLVMTIFKYIYTYKWNN